MNDLRIKVTFRDRLGNDLCIWHVNAESLSKGKYIVWRSFRDHLDDLDLIDSIIFEIEGMVDG